jgi:hypothetical protein
MTAAIDEVLNEDQQQKAYSCHPRRHQHDSLSIVWSPSPSPTSVRVRDQGLVTVRDRAPNRRCRCLRPLVSG